MKRILTLALAICLVMAMAVPASAVTIGLGDWHNWDWGSVTIPGYGSGSGATEPTEPAVPSGTVTYDFNGGMYTKVTYESGFTGTWNPWGSSGNYSVKTETITEFEEDFEGAYTIADIKPFKVVASSSINSKGEIETTTSNLHLTGWKDAATGVIYQAGEVVAFSGDVTLVAQYK